MMSPFKNTCLLWISQGRSVLDISRITGRTTAEIEFCLTGARASPCVPSLDDADGKATLSEGKGSEAGGDR